MIQIQVITHNDLPPSEPMSAAFDELGGNIGRSESNLLVLPDPGKSISRIHAAVLFHEGRYFIRGLGSALPVYLNDQALTNGQEVSIAGDDRIRIGDYVLQVIGNGTDDVAGGVNEAYLQMASSDHPPDDRSLADLLVFAGEEELQNATSPDHQMADLKPVIDPDPFAIDAASVSADIIPSDFDPFAEFSPLSDALLEIAPADFTSPDIIPSDFDPFAEFSPLSDALLEIAPADFTSPDILNPVLAPKDKQPGINEIISPESLLDTSGIDSVDPLVVMGGLSGSQVVAHSPLRDDVSELQAALPAMYAEKSSVMTESSNREKKITVGRPDTNHEELLRAFLTGAGIEPDQSMVLTPQLMNQIGRLLRESTQGTLDLLRARTLAKQEIRAEMTMIAPRENNPLKFSPTVEAALTHLLAPRGQGFMQPVQAMQDAYDDLRAHQFGFMAGMRAALSGMLERLNPEQLQQRLMQKTVFDSLFPMNHRAKSWDLFTEQYSAIAREAQEDFHILFSREFLRAYEAQIARLEEGNQKEL